MSKSRLIVAKEAVLKVLDDRLPELTAARDDVEVYNASYRTLCKRVWESAEAQIKESYKNGVADGRTNSSLLDVTHYMCARITALCESEHNARRHGINDMAEILQRMPFSEEEGACIHRALEPIVAQYGRMLDGHPTILSNVWMKPLLDALERVPGKTAEVVPHYKSMSPKDASILALIAENPGMSLDRMASLVAMADDLDEVRPVARLLLNIPVENPGDFSAEVHASAQALKKWALGNRTTHASRR